jgi:hypothetical protein
MPYQLPKPLKAGWSSSVSLLMVLLIFDLSSAVAQDRPSQNRSAASLHIEVTIVPNVYLPPQKNQVSDPKAPVQYVLSPSLSELEITTQTRDFTFIDGRGVLKKAVLVITTVVLQ